MKTKIKIFLICGLLGLTLALSSCGKSDAKMEAVKSAPAVNVQIQEVRTSQFSEALNVAGTVKAFEDVNLSPEEGGVVKKWKRVRGERVTKNEMVVLLKDEVIKASYEAANAQYKMADLNFTKQQKVYKEKGISDLQYKTFEYTRDAAKAQADLMRARWDRAQLRSPIDGILDDTFPDEGEFAPPGVPVAHIVNISSLRIQAEIPERSAGRVALGTQAEILFDAFPGEALTGKISYLGSTVSPNNRALLIEILVMNPELKLKPEMVAKVRVMQAGKTNAILVDEGIVQQVDRNRMVVYVAKDGAAEERTVKLGGRQGRRVEILEGLNPGDHIVVSGFQKLVQGQPIVVTP